MRLAAAQLSIAERLDRVSLILEPGTITAICGPNGAGKSSLLEALAGLLPAGDGAVFLDRQQIAALPLRERARRIGYLPQAHEIAWDVPVRSVVELGRLPHGDRLAAPVEAALDALDIRDLANRRAQSLSGGETARVLLARSAGDQLTVRGGSLPSEASLSAASSPAIRPRASSIGVTSGSRPAKFRNISK